MIQSEIEGAGNLLFLSQNTAKQTACDEDVTSSKTGSKIVRSCIEEYSGGSVCCVCGSILSKKVVRYNNLLRLPQTTRALRETVRALRLHCATKHPKEFVWNVLSPEGTNPFLSHPHDIQDCLVQHALSIASSRHGVDCLVQSRVSEWTKEDEDRLVNLWSTLTTRRIEYARAWLEFGSKKWFQGRPIPVEDRIPLKEMSFQIIDRLDKYLRDNIQRLLVNAIQALGNEKCVNRYQLCFLERSRHRHLTHSMASKHDDFLYV